MEQMAPVLFDPTSQKDLSGRRSFNDGSVGTEQLECSSPHHDEIEFKYDSIKFPPHGLSFACKNKTPLEIYPQLDSTSPPNDDFSVITQENNCTSEGHRLNGPAPKRRNAWTPLLVSEKTGGGEIYPKEASIPRPYGEECLKGKPEVEKFTLKKPQFRDHIWRYAQMYREETCMTVDLEEAGGNNKLVRAGEPVALPLQPEKEKFAQIYRAEKFQFLKYAQIYRAEKFSHKKSIMAASCWKR